MKPLLSSVNSFYKENQGIVQMFTIHRTKFNNSTEGECEARRRALHFLHNPYFLKDAGGSAAGAMLYSYANTASTSSSIMVTFARIRFAAATLIRPSL